MGGSFEGREMGYNAAWTQMLVDVFFIFKSVERRNDIVSDFLSCICGRLPPEAPVMGERAGGKNIMKSVYPR